MNEKVIMAALFAAIMFGGGSMVAWNVFLTFELTEVRGLMQVMLTKCEDTEVK